MTSTANGCFISHSYASGLYLALWKEDKFGMLERGFSLGTASLALLSPLKLMPNDAAMAMSGWFAFAHYDEEKDTFRCDGSITAEERVWIRRWCDEFLENDELFRNLKGQLQASFEAQPGLLALFRETARIWEPVCLSQENIQGDLWGLTHKPRSHSIATHGLLTSLICSAVAELRTRTTFPGTLESVSKSMGIASTEVTSLLLEHLVSMGALTRNGGTWDMTAAGQLCLDPLFASWYAYYARFSRWLWKTLTSEDRSGVEFESGLKMFDYQKQNKDFHQSYGYALATQLSRLDTAFSAHFVSLSKQCIRFCDVGGGQGSFLVSKVRAYPQAVGVLFDLPETIARAQSTNPSFTGVPISFVGGDFFHATTYPSPTLEGSTGFTIWSLKFVLHDWTLEEQVRILKALRARITNVNDLVIVHEMIYNERDTASSIYIIHTRVGYGDAKPCSLGDYKSVGSKAGFDFLSIETDPQVRVSSILFRPRK